MCSYSSTLYHLVFSQEIKKKIKECKEEKASILDLSKLDVSLSCLSACITLQISLSSSLPTHIFPHNNIKEATKQYSIKIP